jgi:hypothetical protein
MPRDLVDSFIDTYVQALHDQDAAIFAGAGLSIPAETGVRRETAGAYLKAVGIGVRPQGRGDGDRRQNRLTR